MAGDPVGSGDNFRLNLVGIYCHSWLLREEWLTSGGWRRKIWSLTRFSGPTDVKTHVFSCLTHIFTHFFEFPLDICQHVGAQSVNHPSQRLCSQTVAQRFAGNQNQIWSVFKCVVLSEAAGDKQNVSVSALKLCFCWYSLSKNDRKSFYFRQTILLFSQLQRKANFLATCKVFFLFHKDKKNANILSGK